MEQDGNRQTPSTPVINECKNESGLDEWPTFARDKCAFTDFARVSGRKWLL
jgi:hypothetical protein